MVGCRPARVGSSPRLRGTYSHSRHCSRVSQIIPALAGNIHIDRSSAPVVRDHPRACGEHRMRLCRAKGMWGSSPRLRGTFLPTVVWYDKRGIIPALAGNIRQHAAARKSRRDHPRACGEHKPCIGTVGETLGSSPRLRGTLPMRRAGCCRPGIIPALAGNMP